MPHRIGEVPFIRFDGSKPVPSNAYRKEFIEGLRLLAKGFDAVVAAGHGRPVIVGGAAAEFYTMGSIMSGDFDIVTPAQEVLERELLKLGFQRPGGVGVSLRGLEHREMDIAVEVVGSALMDGRADQSRIKFVEVSGAVAAFIGIEDIIADRMGQYCSAPGGRDDMLDQAAALYSRCRGSGSHLS